MPSEDQSHLQGLAGAMDFTLDVFFPLFFFLKMTSFKIGF